MDENQNNATDTTMEQGQEVKTYTQDEVNKLLQSEADRRVSTALAKQKKEYERKLSLSNLDENQRAVAEKDNTIAELQEQLKEFRTIQAKNEMIKVLDARGLSPQFAELIEIDDDVSTAQKRVDMLDNLFKKAVADEVKKRLASPAPKIGLNDGEITKETFAKMSLKQRQELYTTKPELYNKLAN